MLRQAQHDKSPLSPFDTSRLIFFSCPVMKLMRDYSLLRFASAGRHPSIRRSRLGCYHVKFHSRLLPPTLIILRNLGEGGTLRRAGRMTRALGWSPFVLVDFDTTASVIYTFSPENSVKRQSTQSDKIIPLRRRKSRTYLRVTDSYSTETIRKRNVVSH